MHCTSMRPKIGTDSVIPSRRFMRAVAASLVLWMAVASWASTSVHAQELVALAARVEAHDDEAALRLLDELPAAHRAQPRLLYLRGRLLERLGRAGEAADVFAVPLPTLPEAVVLDATGRRARLLARSGRCGAARPLLLAQGRRRGHAAAVARALAAECALVLGDLVAAAQELAAVAQEDARDVDSFAARLELAEAQEAAGERATAARTLLELLVDRPEHPDVRHAEARLRALGAEPTFTSQQQIARAARLSRHRRHEEAVAALDAAGPPRDRAARARYLHLRGMALFKTRHHYAEAATTLAEAARLRGPDAISDEFHAARALSRADQDAEAVTAYRRLVRAHPHHARAAQAEYLAAWLELRMGRARGERSMERFLRGSRGRSSPPSRRRAATWQLAFAAFEAGRHGRAAQLFEQYANLGRRGLERGRGLYWLGRAQAQAGRRGAAIAAYRRAIAIEPLHYYALLARQRLVGLGETPPHPFPEAPATGVARSPLTPTLPAAVQLFIELGLREDASATLRRAEASVREAAPEGRGLEALVSAYGLLGEASRPYRLAAGRRAQLNARPVPSSAWVWRAAYPRPFEDAVTAAARAQGLRSELLYAVMRQESGYNRDALSPADAIGLLQVMPSAAERLEGRLGVRAHRDLLFDPVWNVRFGAAEVAQKSAAFQGNLPLAICAYNAGAARVRRWLGETGEIELDRFVERIPFDETRNYVRRVTSHYARYRYLAEPAEPWAVELPSHVGPADAR